VEHFSLISLLLCFRIGAVGVVVDAVGRNIRVGAVATFYAAAVVAEGKAAAPIVVNQWVFRREFPQRRESRGEGDAFAELAA
jgi:hypothetical protein